MQDRGVIAEDRSFLVALSSASLFKPNWYPPSAWIEHAPFASWLVDALKPRSFVELGTHYGYSFFAVCQTVRTLGLECRCLAVDTWRGDEHASFYGNYVFQVVRARAAREYSTIATLKRATFDMALADVPDGSVDLLHIDGRHFYEDARHDWETWAPKVSRRGVVLFHDTQVFDRGFGVHRLWSEISSSHPSFEFRHGHGLGVLGVGDDLPERVAAFLSAGKNESVAADIRNVYSRLGRSLKGDAKKGRRSFRQPGGLVRRWARKIRDSLTSDY